jgi:hypothetical protein
MGRTCVVKVVSAFGQSVKWRYICHQSAVAA